MAVRRILRLGDPVLREVSTEVPENELASKELKKLIRDMYDTMDNNDGAGLAAPQIGVQKRIFVVSIDQGSDQPGIRKVYINPVLKHLTDVKDSNWEGCLSIPGMRGLVERPRKIQISYFDEKQEKREDIVEGFEAIVLQHEFDHLDGILYVDRLKDTRLFGYNEELNGSDR